MKRIIIGLAFLFSLILKAQENTNVPVKVRTESGVIRGVQEAGISSFKGIPFAAPPEGEFRWRPPQPVIPWEGELDATEFGSNCAQSGWGGAPGTISEGSSE
ncbi:MAG: carboxylesterase family protein, partial [Saprospiraceae bacterium]|nr:carboxylesterase family protein [Saprospiraceae bacterium]